MQARDLSRPRPEAFWGSVAVASLGVFVGSLDSAVNIAFPAMSQTFSVGPAVIKWVVISYVLTSALFSLGSGWLGDRAGHARVFAAGLWVSVLAFAVLGLAPTFGLFLLLRVVQGVGVGLVYGSAPALVTLSIPPAARGRGLGLLNLGMAFGFAVGPAIGGRLVEDLGWRWIYLFRVPPAVLLAVGAAFWLHPKREGARSSQEPVWRALTLPVLKANLLALLANLAMFAIWLLVPYYLVDILGQPPSLGGLLFLLTPLGTAVAAPVSGWGADRLGTRSLVTIGLAMESAGLYLVSRFDAASHAGEVALGLSLVGVGLGIFTVPNMSLVMGALPRPRQGLAGGMMLTMRTLGVLGGVSVASFVFDWRQRAGASFMAAFHDTFLVSTAICLATLLVSLIPVRSRVDRLTSLE
jgi:MFS family permease